MPLLLIFILNLIPTILCYCSGSKIVTAPIQNVTVLDPSVRRGLSLSVGTPPQDLAFGLAGFANNTFLFSDFGSCGVEEPVDPSCVVGRGGIFFSNKSSSWSNLTGGVPAVDHPSPSFDYTESPLKSDVLTVNNTFSLKQFPFSVTKQGLTLNSIGLGSDSTLLKALMSSGAILSKTWSVFFGLQGASEHAQMDGAVVFGGYDRAKTQGENMTAPVDWSTSCRTGLTATVKSIDVNFVNGTSQNLFGSPIRMCLDPAFAIVSFPDSIIDKFQSKAGGDYLGRSNGRAINGLLYKANGVFTGNLSLTFESGLDITIPNDQLVLPNYVVIGNETVFQEDTREVLLGKPHGSDPTDITYLGQPFFTSAYMMVNESAFTVWKSNATRHEDLVAIDSSGRPVCENPSAEASQSQNSLSTGAVAGIAVAGSCAGLGALAVTIFCCWMRSRKGCQAATKNRLPAHELVHAPCDSYQYQQKIPFVVEAPGHSCLHAPAFELPGNVVGTPRGGRDTRRFIRSF